MRIDRVDVWRIARPFRGRVRTAKADLDVRESLIVRVRDSDGRTGLAEGVAFPTAWYLPETLGADERLLAQALVPAVLHRDFDHPREVAAVLAAVPAAPEHPMACAALEPALWDVFGKATGRSLRELIGGRERLPEPGARSGTGRAGQASGMLAPGFVPGGVVVGIAGVDETLGAVRSAVDRGYRRVKLKVAPGREEAARAVRGEFPDVVLVLDANQSYVEADRDALRSLDDLGAACLEEPLRPDPAAGPHALFDRLERLQERLRTPLCLDESWADARGLEAALLHPGLRCYAVKVGKLGGVQPTLDFCARARRRGLSLWMGGMYDGGISKRLHAAFAMLPGVDLPGDLSDTGRYFVRDICVPPLVLENGALCLNPGGMPGLGCELDVAEVERLALWHRWFE